jgi:hypothetical protein
MRAVVFAVETFLRVAKQPVCCREDSDDNADPSHGNECYEFQGPYSDSRKRHNDQQRRQSTLKPASALGTRLAHASDSTAPAIPFPKNLNVKVDQYPVAAFLAKLYRTS